MSGMHWVSDCPVLLWSAVPLAHNGSQSLQLRYGQPLLGNVHWRIKTSWCPWATAPQVLLDVIGHLLTGVMLHCLFYCTKPLTKTLAMILYTNTQTPYNGLSLDFDQANWHLMSSKSML